MPMTNGFFEEPDNDDRAGWAATAVTAFAKETRRDPREQEIDFFSSDPDEKEHAEEVLSDLLCDLRHLVRKAGLDWDYLNERGEGHFDEEVQEEEAEAEEDEQQQ